MSIEAKKWSKLAGIILSSWAVLGIVWTIFTWSFEVRADIDVHSGDIKSNKTDIRDLKEISDSLVKLHEKQQTENDLIRNLCKNKQADKTFCMSKGFAYGD